MAVLQEINDLEIIDISTEGKGIGKADGLVCFVEQAVPGDVVDIRITKKKKSFLEGSVIRFKRPSPDRREPACSHFGTCGGCKWQNLVYSAQLRYKQKYVEDAIFRLAKIDTKVLPILPSEAEYHYRNKLEFTFSNRKWLTKEELGKVLSRESNADAESHLGLGFHIPKLFDKVLDIDRCHLQPDPSNAIRMEIKRMALQMKLSFHDIRRKEGFLRNLIVRNNLKGEWMVVVVFFFEDPKARQTLLESIGKKFPEITSLNYVINPKLNDSIADLEVRNFSGQPYLEERMEELIFRISPKSFFQTNTRQALSLYKVAREYAGLTGSEVVYDLYTGTGTIANFVAGHAKRVVGVEYVKEAIDDAVLNSSLNRIGNTSFFAGDMKDVLSADFIRQQGRPDVIITDPPRAGMHEEVVKRILEAEPSTVVYVSCNPATQARDMALMSEHYRVVEVRPVDMFPHTAHVESVAKLVRK